MGQIFWMRWVQRGNISYESRTFILHNIYGNRLKTLITLSLSQQMNGGATNFGFLTVHHKCYMEWNTPDCPYRYWLLSCDVRGYICKKGNITIHTVKLILLSSVQCRTLTEEERSPIITKQHQEVTTQPLTNLIRLRLTKHNESYATVYIWQKSAANIQSQKQRLPKETVGGTLNFDSRFTIDLGLLSLFSKPGVILLAANVELVALYQSC
jgi:hypothetical protein